MARPLSNLVDNLAEEIYKIKCKYGHDNLKCETFGYKYCECCLEYLNAKDDLIEYKCLCCKNNYQKRFDENVREHLLIHTNFLIMISISLFCYCKKVFAHMNTRMIGTNLVKHHYQRKKFLQSSKHGRYYWCRLHACKKSLQKFEIKDLGEYHDLYVRSDTLLLADVFNNNMGLMLLIFVLHQD